ncbi:MerR family transcriptional regulator [Streptomyces armeniacus]|uniref:MerR family transcriptional regulator n=1 Tax=Streptomyces armeniacus TaxID=83291 RepID=A0A345XSI7_9ACTN|nr:MerR family transcriptional regulator [Streptomyces armeniacus]AXK34603.1 MerR family transcriptional regulator [Streptomyces armeniacus]
MFTIGDFAKHGRVSVRMLRHYDAIGLLRPAHVDEATRYRHYGAEQLARLNRVIALKDLGFSLQQVAAILDDRVSAEELRGMLRLRRAELETAAADTAARLAQVEARLRTIESEGSMPTDDIVLKRLPAVRLAELSGTAASFVPQDIGPAIGPLFAELCRRMEAAGVVPDGPGLARYEDAPPEDGGDSGAITVRAGLPVAASDVRALERSEGAEAAENRIRIVELPAVERAATIVHRGSMDTVLPTVQALAHWIDANGYRSTGYARELTLSAPEDTSQWVTELQEPLTS